MDINKIIITFINNEREVVYKGKITSIPLKDDMIIKDSIKYFDDDSPCFIHRSAIMEKIYVNIGDYFANELVKNRNELLYDEIPINLTDYIDLKYKKIII